MWNVIDGPMANGRLRQKLTTHATSRYIHVQQQRDKEHAEKSSTIHIDTDTTTPYDHLTTVLSCLDIHNKVDLKFCEIHCIHHQEAWTLTTILISRHRSITQMWPYRCKVSLVHGYEADGCGLSCLVFWAVVCHQCLPSSCLDGARLLKIEEDWRQNLDSRHTSTARLYEKLGPHSSSFVIWLSIDLVHVTDWALLPYITDNDC